MLGGKSTGKSHLLRNMIKNYNCDDENKVLYVNLRATQNKGLVAATVEEALSQKLVQEEKMKTILGQVGGITAGVFAAAASGVPAAVGPVAAGVASLANKVGQNATAASLKEVVRSGVSTIVFDEANLTMDATTLKHEEILLSKLEFEQLVARTKELRELSVVLVSSEHAWRFKLHDAGFNVANFNSVIVAGEVDPDAMGKLLETWGVQEELNELLLAAFGGHIQLAYLALRSLDRKRSTFRADRIVSQLGLSHCFEKREATMGHLKNLSDKGFSEVSNPQTDEGAKIMSENGVAGVVSGEAQGLWPEAEVHPQVLIASSHHMRYLIWRRLQE